MMASLQKWGAREGVGVMTNILTSQTGVRELDDDDGEWTLAVLLEKSIRLVVVKIKFSNKMKEK